MEILKQLLSASLDKGLLRLESRATQHMKDLHFTGVCFIKHEKELERLSHIKIPERTLVKNRTTENLRRDISARSIRNNNKNDKDVKVERTRNKTPGYAQPIDRSRSKTPTMGMGMTMTVSSNKGNKANNGELTPTMGNRTMRKTGLDKTPEKEKSERKHIAVPKRGGNNANAGSNSNRKASPSPPSQKKVIRRIEKPKEDKDKDNNKNKEKLTELTIQLPENLNNESIKQKTVQLSDINNDYAIKSVITNPNPNPKKPIEKLNIGEFIKEKYQHPMFESIYSYLTPNDKLNLFSTAKYFHNELCNVILEKKTQFEERNDITFTSSLDDKINDLRLKHKQEDLTGGDIPPFQISRAATKAIELLNDETYNKVFRHTELKPPMNEIVFIFRILFQILDNKELTSIGDDKEFWKKATAFILENNNHKTGTYFIQLIDDYVFSNENIETIKRLCWGKLNNFKPTYYSKICGTTSLIIFLLKDALEYCGVIPNDKKNVPALIYGSLTYLKTVEERINKYMEKLKKG